MRQAADADDATASSDLKNPSRRTKESKDAKAKESTDAKVSFQLPDLSGPVASGATFQLPVVLSGGADIASVPLRIQYDPEKLTLVNVDNGQFLGQDGQPVALVHRDDPPGAITVVASRPPGAVGVSGSGVVCILSFQSKAAGNTVVAITRPGAVTSAQKQLPSEGARVSIQMR